MLLSIFLCLSFSQAAEENDLWLLISSYEDIGITVKDLAFFLATHGYDATPEKCYDGAHKLDESYKSFDYNVTYMYDPSKFDSQGHLWVAVEDED